MKGYKLKPQHLAIVAGALALAGCQQTSQNTVRVPAVRSSQPVAARPAQAPTAPVVARPAPTAPPMPAQFTGQGGPSALPPGAQPGDCYTRILIPPAYKTVTEQVLVEEASSRIETVPAEYDWVEERVMVRPASTKLEIVPAQFSQVQERVMVTPPITNLLEVPAQYDWVEEQVLVAPARTEWRPGRGPIEKIDGDTGNILCLVEIPAEYRTVRKRVMVTPPSTRAEVVPPAFDNVTKTVVSQPETTRAIEIPAEYQTVRKRVMVKPASTRTVSIPARYDTVSKQVKVSEGLQEWREILCETNVTPEVIQRLQVALKRVGLDPGPVDGNLTNQTMDAVIQYQQSKGLASGGLTMATFKSLNIQL